jgi:predicted RecA/RadA family phage recombinase
MKAIFWNEGNSIDYTPGSAVSAGDVVVQGALVGVAKLDIAANRLGALAVRGVFKVVKAAVVHTAGQAAYWDADGDPVGGTAGTGAVTNVATGNTFMGFFLDASAETATTALVNLMSTDATALTSQNISALADVGATAYTAGKILVADGNSYEEVAVSGDATLASTGALTVAAKAITGAKLADAVQDRILTGTVTAAAEAVHARVVTVQLKDSEGNNLAEQRLVRLCVNATASLGTPTATATDTFGAPSAGTIFKTVTAKAEYEVVTDATGKYVFEITHNDAGTSRYIDVFADSKPISSAAIAFDAV